MRVKGRAAARRSAAKAVAELPLKRAQLIADTVSVLCPFCGEPQPNKSDGSEQWTVEDFNKPRTDLLKCVSCDARFIGGYDAKVQFR